MQANLLSARHRAIFFQQLAAQGTGEGQWDQMFRLLQQGQTAAKRAQLEPLAAQFEGGQAALMTALRECGQFLDWELAFIQLGMASANLRAVYRRLAQHYLYVQQFAQAVRTHLPLPLGLLLAASAVLPLAGYWDHHIGLITALCLLALPALIVYGLARGVQRLLRAHQQERLPHWVVDACYRLPGVGSILTMYQTYHYFANLTLCLSGGAVLPQALQQAADCLPYSPWRARCQAVYAAVVGGAKLSEALRRSGMLEGLVLPSIGLGASAQDAQQHLTDAAQAAFLVRMNYWGRWLPQFGLVLVPPILALNLLIIF